MSLFKHIPKECFIKESYRVIHKYTTPTLDWPNIKERKERGKQGDERGT